MTPEIFYYVSLTDNSKIEHAFISLLAVRTFIGEGNGTPLQYSCLENPMDGGAWYTGTSTQHSVII